MRRKLSAQIVILLSILILASTPAFALTPEDYDAQTPQQLSADMLYAESAILMDANSGDVFLSKNASARMHPASTTKIMTLLLGVESGIDLNREISIPQAAADIPTDSSLIPVYPGETMTYGDLLTGFMLNSGNDGANAVAVLVAGSVESFVERMNARAAEIGCQGTHFSNAHGYTAADHYTTAYDMALITRAALQNETFRSIVSKPSATITVKERGEIFVGNRHLVLVPSSTYYYQGAIGVKTGSTSAAGYCYVGAAERNGATIISVVFRDAQDGQCWSDTIRLFDYAWSRYDAYTIDQMYEIARSQIGSFVISNASQEDPGSGRLELEIAQISNSDFLRVVERDNAEALNEAVSDFVAHTQVQVMHDLTAPISRGEVIGDFVYYDTSTGGTVTAKLIASRDVDKRAETMGILDFLPFLRIFQNRLFVILMIVLLVLIALMIALAASRSAAKQRRRRRIYEQRRAEYMRRRAGARPPQRPDGRTRTDVPIRTDPRRDPRRPRR